MKKIKMVMQMKQTECGLCVAQMILNYYGVMVSLSELNHKLEVGRDGISLKRMKVMLEEYGMSTNLYRITKEQMKEFNSLVPFIALSKDGHYVVIEKIYKSQVRIVDPAVGKRSISYDEFFDKFLDKIFYARPGEDFQKIKKTKRKSIFIGCIKDNKKSFSAMVLITSFVYALMFAVPLLSREVLNIVLQNQNGSMELEKWIGITVVTFIAYLGILFLKSEADVKLSIVLDKYLSTAVINKLFKNDIKFFLQRTSADLQYRFSLLRGVKSLLNQIIVSLVLDAGALVVILLYVSIVAPAYLSVLFGCSAVIIGMKFLLRERIILYKNEETTADSKLQVLQNDIFRSIGDIKVLGLQSEKKEQWSNTFERYIEKHGKYERLMARYRSILSTMNLFVPIFTIVLGAWFISRSGDIGEIAVIISLQTILGQYLSSLLSISDIVDNLYLIRSYMTRIEDIMEQEDEKNGKSKISFEGNIKVEDLSYRYPGDEAYALKNINIEIKQGEKIAFTGCTGSGKSTLLNILVGLYKDYSGDIFLEDVNVNEIDENSFRSQISVVPQNTLLFNGSLKENLDITGKHSEEEIYKALDTVALGEFVRKLPMKLNTIIAENGFNFSGGQRQRIALARAIINCGRVICLDEATSSLDNLTEDRIVTFLKESKSTQIIVAHRLSTIKDADRIYVLKDGEIVEFGSHDELLKLGKEYKELYGKEGGIYDEVFDCVG